MKTVGQILKEERFKKGFTLEQVEKSTKIRSKFLTAIETDDFQRLPAAPYIQGFIKNYGDFLGLTSYTMLALLRRQLMQQDNKTQTVIEEPLTRSPWRLTPNKVLLGLMTVLILALFGYFYNQYLLLHQPPPLKIESPQDDEVIKEITVSVYGDTDRDATVTINNDPVLVKEDGRFFKDVELTIGGNTLVIEARSRAGEKSTVTRHVTRLAATP